MKHQRISASSHRIKLFYIPTFVTIFLAMTMTACGFQTTAITGSIWIANEEGNSLTVIDAATNKVVTTLTGIESPHNVQMSPDNKTVWAISGHKSLAVAIDTATYTLKGTAPVGKMPAHIILTPNSKSVYVSNGEDNTVTVIDAATLKVVATIPVGKFPHGLRPSPDGKWVFVANLNDTKVSVIETATNIKVADIEAGQKPAQVGFSPDGKFVYVSLVAENAVAKIDVAKRISVGKTNVGNGPIQVFVSPNDKYLLVANQGTEESPSTTVSIIDTATFSVVKTVETGKGAHGIVIEPSSRFAYITNIFGNNAAILDLATLKTTATVSTGIKPNGISFSSLAPSSASSANIIIKLPETKDSDMSNMNGMIKKPAEMTPTPTPNLMNSQPKMTEMKSSSESSQQVMADDEMMSSAGLTPPEFMLGKAGRWMVGYQFMFDKMEGNLVGTRRVSDATVLNRFMATPTDMTMQMQMGMVMYAPTDKLTLMVMIPYIRKTMNHVMRDGTRFTERTSGIGDIELRGLYSLYARKDLRHRFVIKFRNRTSHRFYQSENGTASAGISDATWFRNFFTDSRLHISRSGKALGLGSRIYSHFANRQKQ